MRRTRMERRQSGFTLIELIFVIVIGGILISMAMSGFRNAQAAIAARGAKHMYATLHQKARARAVETGETIRIQVDVAGDSVYLEDSGGTILEVTHFADELNVDLQATGASGTTFYFCMSPRGYADYGCSSEGSTPVNLEFWLANDSSTVRILPLGQLLGL